MDIFFALQNDNVDFLKSELESGLSPNEMLKISVKDPIPNLFKFDTPLLSIASYYGSVNSLKLLLSTDSIDVNKESNIFYKFRPIHYSIANNQKECFDLLTRNNANLAGILFSSVHFINFEFFNLIISNHLEDVNYFNSKSQPPALIEAIKNKKSSKMALVLLKEGATFDDDLVNYCETNNDFKEFYNMLNDFSQQNISIKQGILTPLHIAADENNFEEAARIIEEGKVDINAVTDNGDTALMKAAHRGSLKIVKLILEQKKVDVDVNQVNNGGVSYNQFLRQPFIMHAYMPKKMLFYTYFKLKELIH